MADAPDKESQTENATEKKLHDSMERGDVPMSREVALFASLACILIAMIFLLRDGSQRLVAALAFLNFHFIRFGKLGLDDTALVVHGKFIASQISLEDHEFVLKVGGVVPDAKSDLTRLRHGRR